MLELLSFIPRDKIYNLLLGNLLMTFMACFEGLLLEKLYGK